MEQLKPAAEEPKCGGNGMGWANVCQDFLAECQTMISDSKSFTRLQNR